MAITVERPRCFFFAAQAEIAKVLVKDLLFIESGRSLDCCPLERISVGRVHVDPGDAEYVETDKKPGRTGSEDDARPIGARLFGQRSVILLSLLTCNHVFNNTVDDHFLPYRLTASRPSGR